MDRTNFEKLRVYQLAELLADEIWTAVSAWDSFAKHTVGTQIVRAADSIGANIAEGLGRGSTLDHRRFVRTARGSLNENQTLAEKSLSPPPNNGRSGEKGQAPG